VSAVTRRRFLLVAAAGVPAALLPLRPWRAVVELVGPGAPEQRLPGLLADGDSARAVGREYLRTTPAAADPRALVAAVADGLPGGAAALRRSDDAKLRALLAARVRRDFEEQAIVDVRGWVLSCTEARLCALAALARRRG
jgi:hypothetical protein